MTATALRPVSVASEVSAQVEVCDDVLGEDLTAYLAGANTIGEFRSWAAGPVLSSDTAARRVAAAVELITVFHTVNRTALAAAWLREMDASGLVPARALRESSADPTTVKALHEAAGAFLG
ncbi:hypothetical protein [Actinoplanes sp. NPDC049265]|uniref:hypothetical protein n=1 Tax=Actinoplanes sp. NPDC049265 TaxID=3363902 RepID=UPI00371C19F8